MLIFKNVLDQETLDLCHSELNELMGQAVWRCSDQFWQDQIQVGVTGVVTSTFVSEPLRLRIEHCLKPYVPEYSELSAQHYLWHRNSGISTHNDWVYKFAATIYLNHNWNIDYGGVFMWVDSHTQSLNAYAPEYNSMILNTEKENHLVSLMSPMAPEKRITLQIWGN
jgi:hypothetical protein